ncbi:MAG: threonine/serine dehydratase [Hyphomicrobiaceae bacterium]
MTTRPDDESSSARSPAIDDIREAARVIAPHAVRTPLLRHPVLDARTGGRVLLKPEVLQRVGAFKFRGAYNAVSRIDPRRYPGGVVACSSGNHAQGVAEAARLTGRAAVIVMPADAPAIKIARTRAMGAEVVLYDRDREDRDAIAGRIAAERAAAFVPPFDHFDIIAGQGTAGLELAEDARAAGLGLDAVIVPCSGGGLAAGIAIAVHDSFPAAEIFTAEPAGFDDLARSLEKGELVRNERTSGSICDALLSPVTGRLNFPILKAHLKGSLAVDDREVADAMRFAFDELKLVVEPGGATGLAALLSGRLEAAGRTVAVVLSGGNVDPGLFGDIIAGRRLA